MKKIKDKIKNLKDYERMALALEFAIAIMLVMFLWNTYDIKKVDNRNKKLNERIMKLEVDYKIYEHDFSQMRED